MHMYSLLPKEKFVLNIYLLITKNADLLTNIIEKYQNSYGDY